MIVLLWACAVEEFAVPEATVFFEDQAWEGTLSFVRFEGEKELCRMDYSLMEGKEVTCDACLWEVSFQLLALSEPCVFSSLESLSFRVGADKEWIVLEDTGWENWGTVEEGENSWDFISSYHFLE